MKTLEESKTEKTKIYQKYVYREDKKIKKWKNREKYKSPWEIEKGDFSRIFFFIFASNNTSKEIIIIKTKTITLLILIKSSYPTYHNNKKEE